MTTNLDALFLCPWCNAECADDLEQCSSCGQSLTELTQPFTSHDEFASRRRWLERQGWALLKLDEGFLGLFFGQPDGTKLVATFGRTGTLVRTYETAESFRSEADYFSGLGWSIASTERRPPGRIMTLIFWFQRAAFSWSFSTQEKPAGAVVVTYRRPT